MKNVSVTLEFKDLAEAKAWLDTQGDVQVKVSATGSANTAGLSSQEAADSQDISKLTLPTLKSMCDTRGITYAARATKATILGLLNGGGGQEAETLHTNVEVPAANLSPMTQTLNEAPANTQVAGPQLTPEQRDNVISNFSSVYGETLNSGVIAQDIIDGQVTSTLSSIGFAGQRLSNLPDDALTAFVATFSEWCRNAVYMATNQANTGAGQGPSNSFL